MRFFSIISLLIVVGYAVWWSLQTFQHDIGIQADQGRDITAPIDQAKQAKQLIESRLPQ